MPSAIFSQALFAPRAVALIGASRRIGSVGATILANLTSAPGHPPIFAVNPRRLEAQGAIWCASIEDLPDSCDLAILCIPAASIPDAIGRLGQRGIRMAVVVSSGITFKNGLRQQVLDAAQSWGMRIIGPNCLGVLVPRVGVNASFAPCDALPGGLAFLSQSGALATAMLDWAATRQIGFSAVVSVGDMADLDLGDLIGLFAEDPETRGILLYVEGVTNAARFMAAARAASRIKPVIAIKGGRSAAAGRAALSHTGALAGDYDVCKAAFAQAGIVMVETLEELFAAAAILSEVSPAEGERLAIITNGGGGGILAVDAMDGGYGKLAILSPATITMLDACMPSGWSRANPVDIIGDAHADRFRAAISTVLPAPEVDALLVIDCPTAVADPDEIVAEVAQTVTRARTCGILKPVLGCWLGDRNAAHARSAFAQADIALFETPADAIRGFSYLVQASRIRNRAEDTEIAEPSDPSLLERARSLFESVRAEGRTLLSEVESKQFLSLFDIPVAETRLAADAEAVLQACIDLPPPYVVKIVSTDIPHKSEHGGVVLGLPDAQAARAAALAMDERIRHAWPQARISGFAVQPMIRRRHAHELFAGIARDATFGPIVMLGAGGTAIEVLRDKSIGLPPITSRLAREMIDRTHIARLLVGYRDVPAADLNAIVNVLGVLSGMALALPDLREMDINPLLADSSGVIALDARVVIAAKV